MIWQRVEIIFVVESIQIAIELFVGNEKNINNISGFSNWMDGGIAITDKGKAREEQVWGKKKIKNLIFVLVESKIDTQVDLLSKIGTSAQPFVILLYKQMQSPLTLSFRLYVNCNQAYQRYIL